VDQAAEALATLVAEIRRFDVAAWMRDGPGGA
jgi:hypothetical protein